MTGRFHLGAFVRHAIVDNFTLKVVAMILAITLFIVVHGEREAVVAAYIPVSYSPMPEDRVLMNEPLTQVRVMVKGPWTRVKRFDEREVDPLYVDLSKVSSGGDYEFQEDMVRLPPGLEVVSISPSNIRLQFEPSVTKVVPVIPRLEGEPAHGYRLDKVTAKPSHVTIRGAKTAVEATRGIESRPLSVKGKTASFRDSIALAPTESHVALVEVSPVELEVAIVEDSAQLKLEEVGVTLRPEAGFTLPIDRLVVSPAQVTLILHGGRRAIEALERGQIRAAVDVHADDLVPGRSRKAQVVAVGLPSGVGVEAQPREVSLTATRK